MFGTNLAKIGLAGPLTIYWGTRATHPLVAYGMYALGAGTIVSGAWGLFNEIQSVKQRMALPNSPGMGQVYPGTATRVDGVKVVR